MYAISLPFVNDGRWNHFRFRPRYRRRSRGYFSRRLSRSGSSWVGCLTNCQFI